MSSVDKVVEFVEGGVKGDLWDIVAKAVCGNCNPPDDACDTCQATKIIAAIEGQVAKAGLDYMKKLAREWVKENTAR